MNRGEIRRKISCPVPKVCKVLLITCKITRCGDNLYNYKINLYKSYKYGSTQQFFPGT